MTLNLEEYDQLSQPKEVKKSKDDPLSVALDIHTITELKDKNTPVTDDSAKYGLKFLFFFFFFFWRKQRK